jgi:predicted neuraminidase
MLISLRFQDRFLGGVSAMLQRLAAGPCRVLSIALMAGGIAAAGEPGPVIEPIFPAEMRHNHASCVVELPDGDLLACWYRGSGERRADDVQIWAARRDSAAGWGERFLLADTPGYPDCNPALFVCPEGNVWLFYPTILDHEWSGALLKFAVTGADVGPGRPPAWQRAGVLHVTPVGFDTRLKEAVAELPAPLQLLLRTRYPEVLSEAGDLLKQRLGWMPRVHLSVLPSGRWLLPLYTDTFSCSIVLISDDRGSTWHASAPLIGWGNIQPSIVRRDAGELLAFMRDNGPFGRIRVSSSGDEGETWSAVTSTDLPNPGAGVEAVRLASGRWAIVYNDTTRGRHSLAVSLSEDEGRTWPRTRHVIRAEPGGASFHYPSIVQARDGAIHITYTHGNQPGGSAIDHARLTEAWLLGGDPTPPAGEPAGEAP